MKKLITILLLLISSVTYSQVIDYNSFDNHLIDSLLFVEINNYRVESESPQLIYSESLHNGLSKYITGVLVRQQSAGHPDGEDALNIVADKVYDEIQSKFPNSKILFEVDSYYEVSLKLLGNLSFLPPIKNLLYTWFPYGKHLVVTIG